MDLTTLSDAELDALAVQIEEERQTRLLVANGAEIAESLAQAYQIAEEKGLPPGEHPAWKRPTGAHNAYASNRVVEHNGKHWRSTTPANVWEPGTSGWAEVVPEGQHEPWTQPTGAHDAFYLNPTEGQRGPTATHNDRVWRTVVDANVWEPTAAVPTLWTDEGAVTTDTPKLGRRGKQSDV